MEEDNNLPALTNPGDSARAFFNFEIQPPPFDPGANTEYSRANAMWLMELCRLVYRNNGRDEFLEPRGFREIEFFDQRRTQAALVNGNGFAVLVFRGTLGLNDWLSNFDAPPVSWNGEGEVHEGFNKH